MQQIPQKDSYKLSEVCQYTDTQPYVLRFWESEFPQLSPDRSRSGQPVYRKRDIDLVLRIKQLLYQEEYTLADAREQLAQEVKGKKAKKPKAAVKPAAAERRVGTKPAPPPPVAELPEPEQETQPSITFDTIPRERYEDAVEEVTHLRLALKDAETRIRKAEHAREKAEETASECRQRTERAAAVLEKLIERLG